jgi:hypothetical protein
MTDWQLAEAIYGAGASRADKTRVNGACRELERSDVIERQPVLIEGRLESYAYLNLPTAELESLRTRRSEDVVAVF